MKTKNLWINLGLIAAVLLAGCSSQAKIGALRNESKSVELGDAGPVRVEINFGAGDLKVAGGAEKLLEADFTYNVAKLKPVVKFTDGTLVVRQPETIGLPALRDITDFRNEWDLRLSNQVPMDLKVGMGGADSELQLAGLSLTRLDISLGAGSTTVDLSGEWDRDLSVTIDTGAAGLTLRLPRDVGVRVEVGSGPHTVDAPGMTKDGGVYTNAAYGETEVTMQVNIEAGIGNITLETEEASAAND